VVYWCSNASYFGAVVFLVNAVVSLIGWRAYRHEATEMLGFERQLLPTCSSSGASGRGGGCFCRCCKSVDWLGLAAIIFLAGAALDLVDDFIGDPAAQAWVCTVLYIAAAELLTMQVSVQATIIVDSCATRMRVGRILCVVVLDS
jgi:hypothetical protein